MPDQRLVSQSIIPLSALRAALRLFANQHTALPLSSVFYSLYSAFPFSPSSSSFPSNLPSICDLTCDIGSLINTRTRCLMCLVLGGF